MLLLLGLAVWSTVGLAINTLGVRSYWAALVALVPATAVCLVIHSLHLVP